MRQVMMRQSCLALVFLWAFTGIAFSAPPERIVSLAPNVTEILYDLGLGDRIVAVTTFCDYPPEANAKPKIGGFSNPSIEAIVAARPDMVVMTDDGNPPEIFERLKKLKINTYVFRAKRLGELPQGMRDLGISLGVKDQAFRRAERVERVIRSYEKKLKKTSHGRLKKAIFIIQPEPLIVAGKGTVIDDALKLLGLQNIASDGDSRYPKYSIEELIRRSPDIIFIGQGPMTRENAKSLLRKLGRLDAVMKGRIYYTSEDLYRLTPKVVHGIDEIAGHSGRN
jgi:iron complex transport system substrate-binding protein